MSHIPPTSGSKRKKDLKEGSHKKLTMRPTSPMREEHVVSSPKIGSEQVAMDSPVEEMNK